VAVTIGVAGVGLGEVAIVLRGDGAAIVGLNVAAGGDPGGAEGGEALLDIAMEVWVAPWAAGIVEEDGVIRLLGAGGCAGGGEIDLAHGDADGWVERAGLVNAGAGGEGVCAGGLGGVRGCDHRNKKATRGMAGVAGNLAPFGGITRIRFKGFWVVVIQSQPQGRPRMCEEGSVRGNGGKSMRTEGGYRRMRL
jgi:hypothetical protein